MKYMKAAISAVSLLGLSLGIAYAFPAPSPVTSKLYVENNAMTMSANVTGSSGGIVVPQDQYVEPGQNVLVSQEARDGSRDTYTVAFSTQGPLSPGACVATFTTGLGYNSVSVKAGNGSLGFTCSVSGNQTVVLTRV